MDQGRNEVDEILDYKNVLNQGDFYLVSYKDIRLCEWLPWDDPKLRDPPAEIKKALVYLKEVRTDLDREQWMRQLRKKHRDSRGHPVQQNSSKKRRSIKE
eukprot:GHVN01063526.1.p2 GENE.GHVN01063526.1~~GHVN01063526.1.p2  ORF type:complete len:108 (-),score=14.77 GHVN01063526.1:499-798(-)